MGAFLVGMANGFLDAIAAAIRAIIFLFPDSPFQDPLAPPSQVNLGWITWLFDFPTWIQHISLMLIAFGIYYFARIAARWLKLVRS